MCKTIFHKHTINKHNLNICKLKNNIYTISSITTIKITLQLKKYRQNAYNFIKYLIDAINKINNIVIKFIILYKQYK